MSTTNVKPGETTKEWVLTDPDCNQYGKQLSDFSWSYIESRLLGNGEYAVSQAVVDLQDYSLDEWEEYISGYYKSIEEVVSSYGFRKALQIIAESIFEQLDFDEVESNWTFKLCEDAFDFIYGWIQKN